MFKYIPCDKEQIKSNSVGSYTPSCDSVEQADEQDTEVSSAQNKEQTTCEAQVPSDEDWEWLRQERCKRLEETDSGSLIGIDMSFEQRGELFKYRQALRDLPATLPPIWNRDSIVWPKKPI